MKRKLKQPKKSKEIQLNIKAAFKNIKENVALSRFDKNEKEEINTDRKDYVYSMKVTFKGL